MPAPMTQLDDSDDNDEDDEDVDDDEDEEGRGTGEKEVKLDTPAVVAEKDAGNSGDEADIEDSVSSISVARLPPALVLS